MSYVVQRRFCRQLLLNNLAARLLGLVLFAGTTLYSPVHLLVERHLDSPFCAGVARDGLQPDGEDAHHGHGGHELHLASDHQLRAACQQLASLEHCPVLFSTVVNLDAPDPWFSALFLRERVNPPGDLLPGPLLPRAPPLS